MYNGIGLRTVRGSGTNGYVQRNLSYINASRTRQTLVHNKRNGSLESFGMHEGGKSRPPHSADILRHEQKRRVELELLELSLNMEERGCDPKVIQDKVKRERERLLTRLHGEGIRDEEKAKDAESSHARQKRKDKEIERIKDAFSIASDYMEGESFDPEMQERRRLERKEKRKQEGKEKEEELQLSQKKREAETMARREPLMSRSRSRPLQDCRSRDCDDAKSRKSQSHSTVKKRRLRRSSALSDWKRRSVSSSCDSSSSRSRSRLHSQKLRKEKRREKDFASTRKAERIVRSRSASSLDSSSDVGCSNELSRGNKTTATKGKKLSASGSPVRSAVLKGKHKVPNLPTQSLSVGAMTSDEIRDKSDMKEEKRSILPPKREKSTKEASPAFTKREVKHKASIEQEVDEAQMRIFAALPGRLKKEEKTKLLHCSRRSHSVIVDSKLQSRKLRNVSPNDRRCRKRSTSSAFSKASRSSRDRRMRSHSVSSDRSRSYSSDVSRYRSRSYSKSRFRQRSMPWRRRRSPSRSRGRGRGRDRDRSNLRNRRH